MNVLDFYEKLLLSTGVSSAPDSEGWLLPGSDIPITVEGKLLVLPTEEVLASYNEAPESVQIFHPVAENVLRKDSPVFNFCRRLYRTSLSADIEILMKGLVEFANNHELATKAKGKQRNLIAKLVDIDEKTLDNLERLFDKVNPNKDNKLIDINVQRGGDVEGERVNRIAYIRLPLVKELLEGNDKPFGVKIRKKDIQVFLALFDILFDTEDFDAVSDVYKEIGTQATHAPSFHALTTAYGYAKERLIKVAEIFGKKLPSISSHDLTFLEGLENIEKYRALLPSFPGNDGEPIEEGKVERKPLPKVQKVRVTPLGTVREVKQEEEPQRKEVSFFELFGESRHREEDERYSRGGRERPRRSNLDLSDVDENEIRARKEREEEAYRRERDRYGRSESRYSRGYEYDQREMFYRNQSYTRSRYR